MRVLEVQWAWAVILVCGVALSGGKDQCWIGIQVNASNGIK
jgi:hypothetical protein